MNRLIIIKAFWCFGLLLTADAQPFERITDQVGLGGIAGTNGVALADYDNDGDVDVYLVSKAAYDPVDRTTWNRLFSNRGDGTFTLVTTDPVLAGADASTRESPMGYKMGASWGDFNNDGWPDLYLTHFGPNQLLKNKGDGTFEDITPSAGVGGRATSLSSSSVWWDFDNDGDLDLYVSNYEDYAGTDRNLENHMFENLGDERFQEISGLSGLNDAGATWTTVALDVNLDGWLDLYLANDFGPNRLYLSKGDKTFEDKTAAFAVEDQFHGMGIAVGDCDGNGFFDIYLTNITESGFDLEINPLFLNTGENKFTHASREAGVDLAGWGWGTAFFDLENDGDEDLFVATGYFEPDYENVLFRNRLEGGEMGFDEMSIDFGLADVRTARGLAVYDFNLDGAEDLLISNFFETPSLYENPIQGGNWLRVSLEGVASNRDGFGTVVTLSTSAGTQKKYHHGAQFLGQSILPVHFGLASENAVEQILVEWPSGHADVITGVVANQTIKIVEGEGVVDGVLTNTEAVVPLDGLQLLGNYPNPFRTATRIQFEMDRPGSIEMEVFNVLGQRIDTRVFEYAAAGVKSIAWSPNDKDRSRLGTGVLLYTLRFGASGGRQMHGKMIYLNEYHREY